MLLLEPSRETAPPPAHHDPLFVLQLCVARRADELARGSGNGASCDRDLSLWTEAQREVFARLGDDRLPRTAEV